MLKYLQLYGNVLATEENILFGQLSYLSEFVLLKHVFESNW